MDSAIFLQISKKVALFENPNFCFGFREMQQDLRNLEIRLIGPTKSYSGQALQRKVPVVENRHQIACVLQTLRTQNL